MESLEGGRFLKRAVGLFETLERAGTERDTAGNRKLTYSRYAALVLLGFFNPAMQSLRGLQRASENDHVQKLLGGGRVSLGSLSESVRVFDPKLLEPIITQLIGQMAGDHPGPGHHRSIADSIPLELARKLVAVDGSVLKALPQIVSAAAKKTRDGEWKLHLQFRTLSGLPLEASVTADKNAGGPDERDVLQESLAAGHVYIGDRGYERYMLYQSIKDASSDYVIRGQDRPVEIVESRTLSAAARAARVVSDDEVTLSPNGQRKAVTHRVRRVVIQKRDQGRQRTDRKVSEQIVLFTSLMDVPAEVLAAIYELRWTIELFFRFLKHVLGCRRLLTNKSEGVAIQVYCSLIACLLLAQATGHNVGRVAMEQMSLYLQGWSTEEELLAGLARHAAELARARERYAGK